MIKTMATNNKKRIYFEGSIDGGDIFEKLLNNNGLTETIEDYTDNVDSKSTAYFDVFYDITQNLIIGSIDEKKFITEIQNQLKISEETAKNILKNVKEDILPSVIILDEDEIEKEASTSVQSVSQIIKTAENFSMNKNKEISSTETPKIPSPQKPIKRPIEEKAIKKIQQASRNDSYREPIE